MHFLPETKLTQGPSSLPTLGVAFLIGSDNLSTRTSIEAVCRISGVQPIAVLIDTYRSPFRKRLKNLARNIRRGGWKYLLNRVGEGLRSASDRAVDRAIVPRTSILAVLRKAFPERCFTIEDLALKYDFKLLQVGSLNGSGAIAALKQCHADLGIVLGTRILKPSTFDVPRMGCINLHKGKVPEYRGMPPGFWELYDGAPSAGVTVHRVAAQLDAGEVVATGEVAISPLETPDSLLQKLHQEGTRALVEAVTAIHGDVAHWRRQADLTLKPRSKPSLLDIAVLRGRLPHWETQSDWVVFAKNLFSLSVYYSGLYAVVRKGRRSSRAAILLYHRVNDYANDRLTVGTDTFASQLLAVARYYPTITSSQLVERVHQRQRIAPTSVLIHFDDAYRDVCTNGGPILKSVGIPATAFVNSGYVDSERAFEHDLSKYPFRFENQRASDLRQWVSQGFELGAHTVNHVDLGTCPSEDAWHEISACSAELQRLSGASISLFSPPFGRANNIRPSAIEHIKQAGYSASFSAYGGFVGEHTSVWDIPRMGVNGNFKPLYLLLEIEGIGVGQVSERLRRIWQLPGQKKEAIA